jgi:murein DD-endopeptidase MepM/ murein hydrolase activator NlpD
MTLPVPGGKIIGTPYSGSHKPGAGGVSANWQSDNAVDIAVPVGTPVYAVSSGVVGPNIGPFHSSNPALAGSRLTVQIAGGDAAYYAHLSRLVVHAGERVHAGQLLGYSGSANGVAHLHFAVEKGAPFKWLANLPGAIAKGLTAPTSPDPDPLVGSTESAGLPGGCATTLLVILLSLGAAGAMIYATGAGVPWPW